MYYFNLFSAKIKKAFQCERVRSVYFTLIIFVAWFVGLLTYQSTNSCWQAIAVGFLAAIYGIAIVTLKRYDEDTLDIMPFTNGEISEDEDDDFPSYSDEPLYYGSKYAEGEEYETDNLSIMDIIAKDELYEIKRLSNAKPQIKQAIDDIETLGKIRAIIKRLDKVVYKKALMSIVKSTYNNLRIYVLQNVRGITAICIAGRALGDTNLSEEDIAKIEEQLKNNRTAFEGFKELLREVPNSFRTAADTAVQLDIEASKTAIKNFNATSNTGAH